MARISKKKSNHQATDLYWHQETELVGLEFELETKVDICLYPQYTIGLHAWFLDQVRSTDPELSAYLHDGESEKAFTISALDGELVSSGKELKLFASKTYYWYVTGLSSRVTQWLGQWLTNLPPQVNLRNAPLQIISCRVVFGATTYDQLLNSQSAQTLPLQFLSPTSFRRKGHHLPLPVPVNVFHSYLRRWNDFAATPVDQKIFLAWVDDCVLITRHQLATVKVLAGKKGAVTGFTGSVEFSLTKEAWEQPDFCRLFFALGKLAPYCGTGHKTTFGLGQTRLGWSSATVVDIPNVQSLLANRIEELTDIFQSQRKRTGGDRALEVASKWATILARREMGDSLQLVAEDMQMPYETVKTYAKLARRALKVDNAS